MISLFFFFFCKQKTAYEMRISYWSSDVCSSDLAAAAAGASYLAFGAFFPSPTKPAARRATPELLAASARFGLPRVAIGGITPDNARQLVAAGADMVAVISGVFDAPDPVARSEEHTSELQSLMRISYAVFCLKKKN